MGARRGRRRQSGHPHLVHGRQLCPPAQRQRLHSHPDPGATWYLLVGATGEDTDGSELEAIAHSYRSPANIEIQRDPGEPADLHRGRVLLEGYDYALRAYTFRKQGEDRVRLTMTPTAPQVNPVFLITGWCSPGVRVSVNDEPLAPERFRAQVCGHDLTVWVQGKFEQPTGIDFRPELRYTICA